MLCGCLITGQQAGSSVFGDRLESIQSLIGNASSEFRIFDHWIFRLLKLLDLELDMVLVELRTPLSAAWSPVC